MNMTNFFFPCIIPLLEILFHTQASPTVKHIRPRNEKNRRVLSEEILHPYMQSSKERLLEFPTVLSCVDYPYQKEIEIK